MTHVENEQSEAIANGYPSLRRTEKTSQRDHYGNGSELVRSNGITDPDQSVGVGGATSEGDCQCPQLESETGDGKKLVDQLEEFFSGYLAYVESHQERLKTRLNANQEQQKVMKEQFENLKQSLLQLVQESE